MHPTYPHTATHRHPTEKPVPPLRLQVAFVLAPLVALWALTHPAVALAGAAGLAAVAWHRLAGRQRGPAGPTPPPD